MTPKLDEVLKEVDASRIALLDAIAGASEAELGRRPDPDAWSAGEVLHHIALIEGAVAQLIARGLDRALAAGLPREPAPTASVVTSLDLYGIERAEPRVQAPDYARPTPGLPGTELNAALERSRRALLAAAERADGYDLSLLTYPHPFLGPLDFYQWFLFCAHHERRHTRQISAALRPPPEPAA